MIIDFLQWIGYNTRKFQTSKRLVMALTYKKLWKLLIDRDMTRSDLHSMTGVSTATLAKMTKGKCISSSVIDRICTSLKCDVGDIMEAVLGNDTESIP